MPLAPKSFQQAQMAFKVDLLYTKVAEYQVA
jgi:hypothetical protein